MKKIFKYLLYLLVFPLLLIGFYFSIAYLLTFFPTNKPQSKVQNNNIHILYSRIHTDIVFNINDINLSKFPRFKDKKQGYLAFGWGDKETYLNTPKLGDIKLSTSLKALFINTPSLMHVSYIYDISRYQSIKKIKLTDRQKKYLKTSIMNTFNFKEKTYKGYETEDFFYTAKGHYNLINTCNTWTGDKLRESNVSMPYWTPFVWSVVNALP